MCRRFHRLIAVAGSTVLLAGVAATASSCSSRDRRDQNYGSDVGATYVPPEAKPSPRELTDAAGDSGDGGPSGDRAEAPDDRASPDATEGGG